MSAIAQCFAVLLLCIQSLTTGSVVGISAKALLLDAIAICLRLSSTLWLDGYLPADASGDYIYQCFDVCSVLMLVFLLHRVLVVQREAYETTEDTMDLIPLVAACLVLGFVLHGNMDDNVLFDRFWMVGLFTSVVAVLPQFWLIMQSGGQAGALTSHYIAAMAVSRFLSGCFAWMAREHITCDEYIHGFNHAMCAITVAHLVHTILLADFAVYYARIGNVAHGGAFTTVTLSL